MHITIAELRARNNKMTQDELAERLGAGVDSVRRWEKNINTISVPYLIKIAQHFDVGTDELLGIRKQEG